MTNSSEIEVAIKIGKFIYIPGDYESKEFGRVVELLDIHTEVYPKSDIYLSMHLRAITTHQGDVSFERFIDENLNKIEDARTVGSSWNEYWYGIKLACFLRGILYLYPAGSMDWNGRFNQSFDRLKVKNLDEFFAYADDLAKHAFSKLEEYKVKQEAKKNEQQ